MRGEAIENPARDSGRIRPSIRDGDLGHQSKSLFADLKAEIGRTQVTLIVLQLDPECVGAGGTSASGTSIPSAVMNGMMRWVMSISGVFL